MKLEHWDSIQPLCEVFDYDLIYKGDHVCVLGKPEHIHFHTSVGWAARYTLEQEGLFYCPLAEINDFKIWLILPLKYKRINKPNYTVKEICLKAQEQNET